MEPQKSKDCVCVVPGIFAEDVTWRNLTITVTPVSRVELARREHDNELVFRTFNESRQSCIDISAPQLVSWIVGAGRGVLADHGVFESMAHREALIRTEVAGNALPKVRAERDEALAKLAEAEAEVARLKDLNLKNFDKLVEATDAHLASATLERHWEELLSGVSEALIDAGFMSQAGGSCVEAIRHAAEMSGAAQAEINRLEAELDLADDEGDGGDEEGGDDRDQAVLEQAASALHAAIEVDDFDWATKRSLAFVYQIIVGWERETLDDIAERYGWSRETVERLVTLHQAFGDLLHGTERS